MRNRFRIILAGLATPVLLGVVLGCPGDITPDPFELAIDEGWIAFKEARYDDAEARFLEALAVDAGSWEPQTGLGWVYLRTSRFDRSLEAFSASRAKDGGQPDPAAGRVLALTALDRPEDVRNEGLSLLERDPDYAFSKLPEFRASDLRWIVARAALDLADYPTTARMLDVLVPGHGLDPVGVTFPERALALLEAIRDQV